mmetsp:Transcript_47960/g.150456  ORF Transcript_47960/g.150456 Transcript_47960/m.150456 type:complete len:207 (-) Transcript_47960:274-894(-)
MLLYKAEVNDLNEALEELENEMQTAVTVALDKAYDMFGKEKKQLVEKIQNLECERQEMISSHRVQEDNSVELEQALREVQQLRSLSDSRESLLRMLEDGRHIDHAGMQKLRRAGRIMQPPEKTGHHPAQPPAKRKPGTSKDGNERLRARSGAALVESPRSESNLKVPASRTPENLQRGSAIVAKRRTGPREILTGRPEEAAELDLS